MKGRTRGTDTERSHQSATSLLVPLMWGASKAGRVAQSAVLRGVKTYGTAGTGRAISGLSGVAADNAALALLGRGTLASGGFGIAGGKAVLGLVKVTSAVVVVATAAAVAHGARGLRSGASEVERHTGGASACPDCQCASTDPSEIGEGLAVHDVCPRCDDEGSMPTGS